MQQLKINSSTFFKIAWKIQQETINAIQRNIFLVLASENLLLLFVSNVLAFLIAEIGKPFGVNLAVVKLRLGLNGARRLYI